MLGRSLAPHPGDPASGRFHPPHIPPTRALSKVHRRGDRRSPVGSEWISAASLTSQTRYKAGAFRYSWRAFDQREPSWRRGMRLRRLHPRLAWVGRSAPEPPRPFFRWSTAKSHSWADIGGRGTGKVAPETLPFFSVGTRPRATAREVLADVEPARLLRKRCRFFLVLPRSLVAPALRHKAPQRGLWLLLRHPVGTLKSRGLWS